MVDEVKEKKPRASKRKSSNPDEESTECKRKLHKKEKKIEPCSAQSIETNNGGEQEMEDSSQAVVSVEESKMDSDSAVPRGDGTVEERKDGKKDRRSKSVKKDGIKETENLIERKKQGKIKKLKKSKSLKHSDSRSGVVAVKLIKSKNSKKLKNAEDVLNLVSGNSFGTGESSSW